MYLRLSGFARGIYVLVHVCICASVPLFVCVSCSGAHEHMCIYPHSLRILFMRVYQIACVRVSTGARLWDCPGVTGGRGKKSVWVMGQRVHGNGSHLLRGKAAPGALIDKPINL